MKKFPEESMPVTAAHIHPGVDPVMIYFPFPRRRFEMFIRLIVIASMAFLTNDCLHAQGDELRISLSRNCDNFSFEHLLPKDDLESIEHAGIVLAQLVSDSMMEKIKSNEILISGVYDYDKETSCFAFYLDERWVQSDKARLVRLQLQNNNLYEPGWTAHVLMYAMRGSAELQMRIAWLQAIRCRDEADERIRLPPPPECKGSGQSNTRMASVLLDGDLGWQSLRSLSYCESSMSEDEIYIFAWERGWFMAPSELLGSSVK